MKLSKSTLVAPIPGRDEFLLVQPMTGQAAVLPAREVGALRALDGPTAGDLPIDTLLEAGFVVRSDEDDRALVADAYADYLGEVEKTPTQLIFVPTFGCNLSCTYCYQEVFDPSERGLVRSDTIDAFFRYVDRFHADDAMRPYLTLFGGEPLVATRGHHDRAAQLLRGARERGIGAAVVTNGYDLETYAPMLAEEQVREVQVTLDGPEQIHDKRRPHLMGGPTFARIERGIDLLVKARVPVNLRVVVDKANLDSLPELARIAARHGWLDLPESRFKTQIGRNYELFGCASRQRKDQLFGRTELWERFVELAEASPELARFHRPRFHGMRHLAETGELPAPNFDSCPATKKEWAFGPDGGLYGCTATVGNPKYRLGSYSPEILRDEAAIARWRERNIFTITACQTCESAAICGGGCGAIAADRTGDIQGPDCRPVRELVGLGAKYYGLGRD